MRLFIAIQLSGKLLEHAAGLQRKLTQLVHFGISCPAISNLHLTLSFLGECEEARVKDISAALDHVAKSCRAFELHAGKVGIFPEAGPARVIWLAVEKAGQAAALLALQAALHDKLARLNFSLDPRPFKAHVTLARVKKKIPNLSLLLRRLEGDTALGSEARQVVSSLELYSSTPTQQGAVYLVLHRSSLKSL